MPTQKIDPKVIFASDAPAIDKPPVFSDKTKGWDVARANDGRPEIKQMNKMQQDTDLKILWLNENAVLPYDASIDYPDGSVTLKDGSFKQLSSGSWVEFLDDFADKDAVKRGIANRYDSSLTYNLGERVVLINGDIVKSTVNGNKNNPNTNMAGWSLDSLTPSKSLSDLTNKIVARTNLDVYSKAETNSIAGTPSATETVAGKAKIATTAIAQAGVNDTDNITAKKLRDALNANGDAPISACRAWVNFSATGGVITIKGSLNIASVTRVSAGVYTVNFNIPMPIENYAVFVSSSGAIYSGSKINATSDTSNPTIKTVNSIQVAANGTTTFIDTANMSVGVFC